VTLARLRDTSSRQVADYLATRALLRPLPFKIARFVLFSSRNSVGGGPYVVEADYPLLG
jgi:2'-5' RNA ligase